SREHRLLGVTGLNHESSTRHAQDCAAFPPRNGRTMREIQAAATSKVPEVTALFWIIKILATTLGETAGDAVSMALGLGYLLGSAIFATVFVVIVLAQIASREFRPWLYWLTIIATTTVGTTLADYATRSLGIGYAGGSAILLALLLGSFMLWYRDTGSLAVGSVRSPRSGLPGHHATASPRLPRNWPMWFSSKRNASMTLSMLATDCAGSS